MVKLTDKEWKILEYYAAKFQWSYVWNLNNKTGNATNDFAKFSGCVKPKFTPQDLCKLTKIFRKVDDCKYVDSALRGLPLK